MNLGFVNTRTGATLPTYVVGTDGGLTTPQKVTNWRHAGAEPLRGHGGLPGLRIGDMVELRNSSAPNNATSSTPAGDAVPGDDGGHGVSMELDRPAAAGRDPRGDDRRGLEPSDCNIDLEHDDVTNEFMINGMTWHDVQAGNWNIFTDESGATPKPGSTRSGGSRTTCAAYFSRLVDFRILSRRGAPAAWRRGSRDRRTSCTSARPRPSSPGAGTEGLPRRPVDRPGRRDRRRDDAITLSQPVARGQARWTSSSSPRTRHDRPRRNPPELPDHRQHAEHVVGPHGVDQHEMIS